MIGNITYEEIINIANELSTNANKVKEIIQNDDLKDILDFTSTVEGYAKYLETTVSLYKAADNALKDLK